MIRLVIVDDHTLFRDGLAAAMRREPDIEVVGQAGDGIQAQEVVAQTRPDVVLMDVAMPITDGFDATRQLIRDHPALGVLIVSEDLHEGAVMAAIKTGARGCLPKTASLSELLHAIHIVAGGMSILDPTLTGDVLQDVRRLHRNESEDGLGDGLGNLTPGEVRMLARLSAGMSNKEIASALSLADSTVKNKLSRVFTKIDVLDRTQAAIWALRHGIAPVPAPGRIARRITAA